MSLYEQLPDPDKSWAGQRLLEDKERRRLGEVAVFRYCQPPKDQPFSPLDYASDVYDAVTFQDTNDTAISLLAYRRGDPGGVAFLLPHGSPGSVLSALIPEQDLIRAGVQTVAYNRYGYFGTTCTRGEAFISPRDGRLRTIADDADDQARVLDYYGIDKAWVVGKSGGASRALMFASKHPSRTLGAVSLGGLSPLDNGPDSSDVFKKGMSDLNDTVFNDVFTAKWYSDEHLYNRAQMASDRLLLLPPEADFSKTDEVWNERYPELLPIMRWGIMGGITTGGGIGWVRDTKLNAGSWEGWQPIHTDIPVMLYQGMDDSFTPPYHALRLKQMIPHAKLTMDKHAGHLAATAILPFVIGAITRSPKGRSEFSLVG